MLTDQERTVLLRALHDLSNANRTVSGEIVNADYERHAVALDEKLRGYGVRAVLPPMRENEELLG